MLPVIFQVSIGFGGFQSMISNMLQLGFFQFLFPFLLALAIFYGVFTWALKEQIPNSARGLVALVLAFFVMLFASANPGIVQFFQNLSGFGLMVATAILFIAILLGLTGNKINDILGMGKDKNRGIYTLLLLAIVVIIIVIFFGASSFVLPGVYIGNDIWTIVFFIVILAVVVWFLGSGEEKSGGKTAAGKPPV